MTELVLTLSRALRLSDNTQSAGQTIAREMVVLAVILALLQIADGVLTGIGVMWFGTAIEGNGLLRTLMDTVGPVAALLIAKSISISVIVILVGLSPKVTWLRPAMYAVIGLYLCLAIVPWTYILATQTL